MSDTKGLNRQQMADRVAAGEAVEQTGEAAGLDAAVGGQEAGDFFWRRCGRRVRQTNQLDPVASRDQRGFGQCRNLLTQAAERRRDLGVGVGQSFAHRDRRRPMVYADNKKRPIHRASRSSPHVCRG